MALWKKITQSGIGRTRYRKRVRVNGKKVSVTMKARNA